MKKMDNKGFSLVELIIVIAIMAVLIGVLAPQFIKYVERSRNSTDVQNAEEIRDALQAYHVDTMKSTGDLPSTATITVSSGGNDATENVSIALSAAGVADAKCKSKQTWSSYTITYSLTGDNMTWSYGPAAFSSAMN